MDAQEVEADQTRSVSKKTYASVTEMVNDLSSDKEFAAEFAAKMAKKDLVLDLPMQPNEAGAATIRDYLKILLLKLLRETEGFSGKRPFGTSSWQLDLHQPLIMAGLIKGEIDPENGWIEKLDQENEALGNELIRQAVERMCNGG